MLIGNILEYTSAIIYWSQSWQCTRTLDHGRKYSSATFWTMYGCKFPWPCFGQCTAAPSATFRTMYGCKFSFAAFCAMHGYKWTLATFRTIDGCKYPLTSGFMLSNVRLHLLYAMVTFYITCTFGTAASTQLLHFGQCMATHSHWRHFGHCVAASIHWLPFRRCLGASFIDHNLHNVTCKSMLSRHVGKKRRRNKK